MSGVEYFKSESFFWIKFGPPFGLILQPMCEPGEDGILPGQTLVVVGDDVIFTIDLDIADRFAQDAQSGEELLAFVGRYVGIDGAVQQEYGRVDFVCIEQWRLLDIEVGIVPWIRAILSNFAISITPVSAAPV